VVRAGIFQRIGIADFGLSWSRVRVVKPRPDEGFSAASTTQSMITAVTARAGL
jgi:hypothetical protein